MRAAMVYHYADAETEGHRAFNQAWAGVLRNGDAVEPSAAPITISR